MHDGKLVSIINYGWESPEFYRDWIGESAKDSFMPEMSGASIDMTSPDLVNPDALLALFSSLLNEEWITRFKRHYGKVKSAVSKKSKKCRKR